MNKPLQKNTGAGGWSQSRREWKGTILKTMITVKYGAFDTSNLDHDEIGAECSVLNPTSSSDATTLDYMSSSLVIRDLTESITKTWRDTEVGLINTLAFVLRILLMIMVCRIHSKERRTSTLQS